MTRLLLSSWLLLFPFWLFTQWEESSITQVTTLEGLSQNNVQYVFEDSRGFIWLGTTDGLNRYDGHSFQTYQMQIDQPGSLQTNSIHFISEDENQILWIGTRVHPVCFFDLKTDRFVQAAELPPQYHLPDDFIFWGVVHGGNGEHWVCGQGDVLLTNPSGVRSLKQEGVLPPALELALPRISSQHPDSVWLVVQSGKLFCLSKDREHPEQLRATSYPNQVLANEMLVDKRGLFLGTNEGLYHLKPGDAQPIQLNQLSCLSLHLQASTLWIGTRDGAWAYRVDSLLPPEGAGDLRTAELGAETHGKRLPQISGHIYDIHEDRSGAIWLGTKGNGLIQFQAQPGKFRSYSLGGDPHIRRRIRAVVEDHSGRMWVGSDGKGMFQLTRDKAGATKLQPVNPYPQPDRLIHRLHEFHIGEKSYLFQGTHYPSRPKVLDITGDSIFEVSDFEAITSQKGYFTDMVQDSPWIWVSTYSQGIYRYNYLEDRVTEIRAPGDAGEQTTYKGRSLLVDRQGRLWIGTSKGLIMIESEEKAKPLPRMTIFNHIPNDSTSLSHDYILPLMESTKGDIWIGTMGGGLNRWVDSTQSFRRWTTQQGLPSNTLKAILEDAQGNLWISSNKGISQFDLAAERFINYDPSDGLQDYEFSDLAGWKRQTGEMYFGGVRGLNAFFPEQIRQDSSISRIILTDLQVLNERVAPQQFLNGRVLLDSYLHEASSLRLRHDEHTFTLSFVGLNFRSPQKIQYQYRLENYDETWIHTDATARFAKYTKIPPGEYRFQVRASNSDGIWNGPIKSLAITIAPPWWKSTVAYAGYLLAIGFLIFFFQQYSLIRIQRKNELVMQAFEKEKVQELAQMKLQFFANVSHEFRTPLTLIQGYVEKTLRSVDQRARQDLLIIQRNTRILLKLISELMDLQKMEQGKQEPVLTLCNLGQTAQSSFASFQWWAQQKELRFELRTPPHPVNAWVDPHQIERVLYNLLSNAFKHTPKGGNITLGLEEQPEKILFTVQDTGSGIPRAQQAYVFKRFYQATKLKELNQLGTGIGLAYAKAIVEKHRGQLFFESAEGLGTTFFMALPKRKKWLPAAYRDVLIREQATAIPQKEVSGLEEATGPVKGPNPVSPVDHGTPHLLLVEDNVPIRSMLKEILGEHYQISEAAEGEAALEFCVKWQPDLVVSDVMMPGMDGVRFCTALKEHAKTNHIPVILLTAKAGPEMERIVFEHGADAYVTKP
ncbi:MAG: two-component regulator propeller domain-containing protein, partial [Bacteroidota bacterium]